MAFRDRYRLLVALRPEWNASQKPLICSADRRTLNASWGSMGQNDLQLVLLFGTMALSYGVVAWVQNLRRGEELSTSLTHGPALIVLLVGFLLFVGGGTWVAGLILRLLSHS